MPPLYNFCKKKHLVETKFDEAINYIRTHCLFALTAMLGYMVLFRVVVLTYAAAKANDNKMWNKIPSPMLDRGDEFKNSRCILDEVDGVELDERSPCPQSKTNENILVGIHVKTEKQLESSAKSEIHEVEIHPTTNSYTPIPAGSKKKKNGTKKSALVE